MQNTLFVLFPPGTGLSECYAKLAQTACLPCDYLLVSKPNSKQEDSIQHIARLCFSYILEYMYTYTDIIIGGWSFGGNVAYECSNLLFNAGIKIEKLALFDSWGYFPNNLQTYQETVMDNSPRSLQETIKNREGLLKAYTPSMNSFLKLNTVLFKASRLEPPYCNFNHMTNYWEIPLANVVKVSCFHNDMFSNNENIKKVSQALETIFS